MAQAKIEIAEARRREIEALIRDARKFAIEPLWCSGEELTPLLDDLADVAELYLRGLKCQQK